MNPPAAADTPSAAVAKSSAADSVQQAAVSKPKPVPVSLRPKRNIPPLEIPASPPQVLGQHLQTTTPRKLPVQPTGVEEPMTPTKALAKRTRQQREEEEELKRRQEMEEEKQRRMKELDAQLAEERQKKGKELEDEIEKERQRSLEAEASKRQQEAEAEAQRQQAEELQRQQRLRELEAAQRDAALQQPQQQQQQSQQHQRDYAGYQHGFASPQFYT